MNKIINIAVNGARCFLGLMTLIALAVFASTGAMVNGIAGIAGKALAISNALKKGMPIDQVSKLAASHGFRLMVD